MAIMQRRVLCSYARVLAGASLPLTAAFFLWGYTKGNGFSTTSRLPSNTVGTVRDDSPLLLACSSLSNSNNNSSLVGQECNNRRTGTTPADVYFQTHQELPLPRVMHAVLEKPEPTKRSIHSKNIFVVGDVHGCFDELQQLHKKAVETNDHIPFDYVILVGDMCDKGPFSAQVVRFVRTTEHWLSVRGNHDDGALAAALGDVERRKKKKYKWVLDGEESSGTTTNGIGAGVTLSDEDVQWLSELPYSITIPGSYHLGDENDVDTLIIHGGLIPGVDLQLQTIETMITIREVQPVCKSKDDGLVQFEFHKRKKGQEAVVVLDELAVCTSSEEELVARPWASVWKGPQRVIFGHDARRGLQRYQGDFAIGLDTGAVYGKHLTGIILPERKLVSIETTEHKQ
jgi:predicted phosphodiesterase